MHIHNYINDNVFKNSFGSSNELPFPTYHKKIKKNEIITPFGSIEDKAIFLVEGIIESAIENNGEIKIIDFVFPNNFICSYTSFLMNSPSDIQTKALTDCKVEYILKSDLEKAYQNSIVANKFGKHAAEQFLIKKIKRENEFLTLSAEERYVNLIDQNPEIIKSIPVHKIAKYLGIHPESLSRIRSKVYF
ncbi:Crp/Fnr family transcriptional regulator [Flavobacteriaceae bacterium XHP0103]|uniref:Crp/Fnr family transcriptional regulator n=1 Tax=Marixanthotalea marina TaxID=2844359 RepID=UPI002989C954|nr:Crp/Fnr family transcriptional regulator [Marixanthotalea marina]MBU3821184.1 Crp/Fnr family transcriptional regulator [Marixanthotalea marina]